MGLHRLRFAVAPRVATGTHGSRGLVEHDALERSHVPVPGVEELELDAALLDLLLHRRVEVSLEADASYPARAPEARQLDRSLARDPEVHEVDRVLKDVLQQAPAGRPGRDERFIALEDDVRQDSRLGPPAGNA